MNPIPHLIGMIHLDPLPGSPAYEGHFESVIKRSLRDAVMIEDAGFDGIMVENFGDAPFFPDDVPAITVAAMTRATCAIVAATAIPTGVNVLRNDALSALAVAAASGASFIRVNVLSGTMFTDQGPIVGRAAEVARLRGSLDADVAIMADVLVKHATPPPGLTLEDATRDLAERGSADALIVSGPGTGSSIAADDLTRVADASDLPVFVGSGATADTIGRLLETADGAIVGSSIKHDGIATNAVDPGRATAFVAAATGSGSAR